MLKSWGAGSNGNDAATGTTIYYTAGANSSDTACGNRPEWAGHPCVTKPAANITGHDPAKMPDTLPTRRVTAYNRYGEPATISETNAGKTRTTTITFDNAGRLVSTQLTADDGTTPVATATTTFDPASGENAQTTAGGVSLSREYDLLGRVVKYTDADGGITTMEYDSYGRPIRTVDPTGTVTYAYDRGLEPRDLLTSLTDSTAGTFTVGYSADGQLTTVKYPGGITRTDTLDTNLQPAARSYTRDSDGANLYTESIEENANSQWARHTYTGGSKTFTYDPLGHLTKASHLDAAGQCTVRGYEFAGQTGKNANRTSRRMWLPATDGSCDDDATADATVSYTYDTANRLVTDSSGAYTYDAFGRNTILPSGLTNTFHANDIVASQTLGDNRQSWTLDPAIRLRAMTAETRTAGEWGNPTSKINHYNGATDSPKWITENAATGVWTRNVHAPDGELAVTSTNNGGKTLHATNLHGDIAFTLDITVAGAPPSAYYDYDEYGNPTAGVAARYGWLGGHQRSTEAIGGVTLMGARLYSTTLGRFLSPDPEPGGSCNDYEYTCGDPINAVDLDGRKLMPPREMGGGIGASLGGGLTHFGRGAYRATGQLGVRNAPRVRGNTAAELARIGAYLGIAWMAANTAKTIAKPGTIGLAPAKPAKWCTNKASRCYKGDTIVYEIIFSLPGTGKWETWKYGISTNSWKRPAVQVAQLKKMTRGFLLFEYNILWTHPTRWQAEVHEWFLVAKYFRDHGHCPYGQFFSCR